MSKKVINSIIMLLTFITVFLVAFGFTYAYVLLLSESSAVSGGAASGKIDVVYTNGADFTGKLISYPDNSKAVSVTAKVKKNSASVDVQANLVLHITTISSELATTAFKWEVYKDSDTSIYTSGNFNGKAANGTINLVSNYVLTTTDTTFTVKLWIDSNLNTNTLTNKSFKGYVDVNARNVAASTS